MSDDVAVAALQLMIQSLNEKCQRLQGELDMAKAEIQYRKTESLTVPELEALPEVLRQQLTPEQVLQIGTAGMGPPSEEQLKFLKEVIAAREQLGPRRQRWINAMSALLEHYLEIRGKVLDDRTWVCMEAVAKVNEAPAPKELWKNKPWPRTWRDR